MWCSNDDDAAEPNSLDQSRKKEEEGQEEEEDMVVILYPLSRRRPLTHTLVSSSSPLLTQQLRRGKLLKLPLPWKKQRQQVLSQGPYCQAPRYDVFFSKTT